MQSLIPPEPRLPSSDNEVAAYTRAKALREQAIAEMGQLFDVKSTVEQRQAQWSDADVQRYRETENAVLAKTMPVLKDPAKLAAFDQRIKSAAQEFGFSESEIDQTADHRIRTLVHYATLGKKAEANRKNAARRVETPKQGKGRPAQMTAETQNMQRAKARFLKDDSIENAVRLGWD